MPWPLGTGELQTRLKRALGIRGAIPLELDESIIPVVITDEIDEVFQEDPAIGMFFRQVLASVGNFSRVNVAAAPGTLLYVEEIWLTNPGGAAVGRRLNLRTGAPGIGFFIPRIRDSQWQATSTPNNLAASASEQTPAVADGREIADVNVLAGGITIVRPGIVLDGDGGVSGTAVSQQALAVQPTVVNQQLDITMKLREYTKR